MKPIEQFIYALNTNADLPVDLFEKAYPMIKKRLVNYFYKNNIRIDDAEDIIFEIFTRLLDKNDLRGTSEGEFINYCKGIIQYQNKKLKRISLKERDLKEYVDGDGKVVAEEIVDYHNKGTDVSYFEDFLRENIADCINKLEDRKTMEKTITEKLYAGISYEVIAQELNTPYDTIYARFKKAKQKLKLCLEKKGINKEVALDNR